MTKQHPVRVWITGSQGLIGRALMGGAGLLGPGYSVRGLTRQELDLVDFKAVDRERGRDKPDIIIHCAAMTVVSLAQKNPEAAHRINFETTRHLVEHDGDTRMVFFSTDLVFDGCRGNYQETDPVNPLHVYGETKAKAEMAALRNPKNLVVRTSLNGGASASGNRAFNEQLRESIKTPGAVMTLFTDEFRCPIAAVETARAVWQLVLGGHAGMFHLAGAEKLSRWQMGCILAERWGVAMDKIRPGLAKEFTGPPRALDTSLDIHKIQSVLPQPLPGLRVWLKANPLADF